MTEISAKATKSDAHGKPARPWNLGLKEKDEEPVRQRFLDFVAILVEWDKTAMDAGDDQDAPR